MQQQGHPGLWSRIFIDRGGFREAFLKAFPLLWSKIGVLFSCLLPGFFLRILWCESDRMELKNYECCGRGIAKTFFHRSWISHDSGSILMIHDLGCPVDALETG